MSVEHRGGGAPKGEPTPSEAKRPEENQPTLEVGEGRGGVPPPQGERQPEGSDHESKAEESVINEGPMRPRVFKCRFHLSPCKREEIQREPYR
jgi:hypothetical protein